MNVTTPYCQTPAQPLRTATLSFQALSIFPGKQAAIMFLRDVITVILAGGVGTRLHPLTADRAKPAVPFAGKYRIIDFTLSNCEHSGLRRILVLTQYKSHSLQKHLRDGWSIFNPAIGEYVTVVPPQMRTGDSWYESTADAVYQNLYLLERNEARDIVVLSGDHVYRMDYAAMVHNHRSTGAAATVACMEVPIREASSFGVVGVDSSHRVIEFQEKPARPKSLPYDQRRALVSMGVYVFNAEALSDMLRRDHENPNSTHDFGTDVLPRMLTEAPVYAYQFGGAAGRVSVDRYWRDVGTIDSFYQANMELLHARPPMNLYQKDWPIRTFERRSPPARTAPGPNGSDAQLFNSILSSGVVVSGGIVRNSVLSPHVRVDEGAVVIDSVLFDDVRIGEGARVKNCIIDKGVYVPPGTNIGFDRYEDQQRFTVSENGVTVVPKDYRFDSEFDESAEPPKLSLNRQVG